VANNNVNVYLDNDLAERVQQAKDAGTLDVKEVVKDALRMHLEGGAPDHQGDDASGGATNDEMLASLGRLRDEAYADHQRDLHTISVALGLDSDTREAPSLETILDVIRELKDHPLRVVDASAAPIIATAGFDYELKWADSSDEVLNLVDVINEHNGKLRSVAKDEGKFLVLIAWPKQAADQEAQLG
jgi:hypothetical protein